MRLLSVLISMPMAPCATAGSISSMDMIVVMCCESPSRLSPAQARKVASAIPSVNLRKRVSTLPRNCTGIRSGRKRRAWALRRTDEDPSFAARGKDCKFLADRLMNASRASSRGRMAAKSRPGGTMAGMSFIECTARSMVPACRASSISLVNRPLPPISASGRSEIRSPVVTIFTISMLLGSSPWAATKRSRVSWAWARARGDPLVPMRSVVICMFRWLSATATMNEVKQNLHSAFHEASQHDFGH